MAMSALKQRLLKIGLANIGYRNAKYSEKENAMIANPSDEHFIKIKDDGGISYYREHDYIVFNEIKPMSDRINEIIAAWDKAPYIPIENISNFRILSEYNNIVLAARNDSEEGLNHGFQFVTWKYTHDRTALEHGNYTTDYETAKEDFSSRSGLINRYKMFSETELKLIHQGLVFLGANFSNLTAEQMTNVGKLIEKVEMIVPAIQQRSLYESHDLVAEDGLEM